LATPDQESLTPCLRAMTERSFYVTTDVKALDPLRDMARHGARDASAASWGILVMGTLWILYGVFVSLTPARADGERGTKNDARPAVTDQPGVAAAS